MLTNEQVAIINANFEDILVVEAYAGCGKTSTLIEFCKKRANNKILYLAYNSSMAAEAKSKFKNLSNVEVMTMHSLAYKHIGYKYKDRFGNLKANFILYFDTIRQVNEKEKYKICNLALQLFRKFCNSNSQDLKTFFNNAKKRDSSITDEVFSTLLELQDRTKNDNDLIYEHDFYLKEYQLSNPKLDYDYILVDEAQDINECVTDIVLQQNNSKKVFIGDSFQSIYSFRGASNSLKKLVKQNNAKILMLTNSFRCSEKIAEIANDYLKLVGSKNDFIGLNKKFEDTKQKAYISRTNAKLFEIAINNLDKKIFFVGGLSSYNFNDLIDILNLMLKGSKKYENFNDFKKYLNELEEANQQNNILNILENNNLIFNDFNELLAYINSLQESDGLNILNIISSNIVTIKNPFYAHFKDFKQLQDYISTNEDIEVQSKINMVLKNINKNIYKLIKQIKNQTTNNINKAEIILSTAHKSKGLEFLNVELTDDFIDVKDCIANSKPIEREEIHLLYVAITRAKQELICDKKYILD
ncbi:UvrD-helicase domain-containing protein [Campylobacter sp. RM12651]|uniref:UvrD-helicase domain-containing protein n=1 Tax=Campylobacter sp. RM12651 TaxID=1660079 RepID=UPI001EFBA062|nr:UvrD-helicase domain-containing protein [Campylobacter sp. RM12651]ULO03816.1 putative helicase, UvrD/REP family [Campylobacter sp. RM12651]